MPGAVPTAVAPPQGLPRGIAHTVRVGDVLSPDVEFTSIDQARDYAVSRGPGPAAPWTVEVYAGVYDESIAGADWVSFKALGPAGTVVVRQADATVLAIGGSNATFEGIVFELAAPTGARSAIVEGGAPRTAVVFKDCEFRISVPGGFAHRFILLQGASDVSLLGCRAVITDAANGAIQLIRNDTAAATVTVSRCDFTLNTTGGSLLWSDQAGLALVTETSLAGTAVMYTTAGTTVAGRGNSLTASGGFSVAGGTVTEQAAATVFQVYAGMAIGHALSVAAAGSVIFIGPGVYAESDLAMGGDVHLVGSGAESCQIVTDDAANPIISSAVGCTLSNLTVRNLNAAGVSLLATGDTVTVRSCNVGLPGAAADGLRLQGAAAIIYDSEVHQTTLEIGAGTLNAYQTTFTGHIYTSGALAHSLLLVNTYHQGTRDILSQANGATTCTLRGVTGLRTLRNDGIGAFAAYDSQVDAVQQNSAAGSLAVMGGHVASCTGAAGTVTWLIGTVYHVIPGMRIGHAIGAGRTVYVHRGTYTEKVLPAANCLLEGEDKAAVTVIYTATVDDEPALTGGATFVVRQLKIVCDGNGQTVRARAVEAGANGFVIEDCDLWTQNGAAGSHVIVANASLTLSQVTTNISNNLPGGGASGLKSSGAPTVTASDCSFYNAWSDIDVGGGSFTFVRCAFNGLNHVVSGGTVTYIDCRTFARFNLVSGGNINFRHCRVAPGLDPDTGAAAITAEFTEFLGNWSATGAGAISHKFCRFGGNFTVNNAGANVVFENSFIAGNLVRTAGACTLRGASQVMGSISSGVVIVGRSGDAQTWNNVGSAAVAAVATAYALLNSGDAPQAAEADAQVLSPVAGMLCRLYVNVPANTRDGNTVFTVRLNGAPTAITLTVGAGATGVFSEVANFVSLAAGGLVSVEIASAAGAGAITAKQVSLGIL